MVHHPFTLNFFNEITLLAGSPQAAGLDIHRFVWNSTIDHPNNIDNPYNCNAKQYNMYPDSYW